jgi:hypothetical protein
VQTVIVIGAGGSLAQASSLRPSRAKDHPPLDADFFRKSELLAKTMPGVKKELDNFLARLKLAGQFTSPFEPVTAPLEQFFADVYYEVASQRRKPAFDVLVGLMRLYAQVLAETTNWMAVHQGLGALDKLLRLETLIAAPHHPTVVTFNQDLVIENVVARLPRQSDRWCLSSLYGDVTLSQLFATESGASVFNHHAAGCVHNPPIELLKLHGSLNWGLQSTTEDPSLGTVFPRGKNRTVHVTNRRRVRVGGMMRSHRPRGRNRWHLWPLLVPPIYDKQRVVGMQFLQTIWDKASVAISQADRLILVGYSLPESDISARQLLRRSFATNQKLNSVTLVNPDPTMVPKVQRVLGCQVLHVYADLPNYLAHQGTR